MSDDGFFTTRWTTIQAVGDSGSPTADEALQALCSTYWFPLYSYVRRRGYSKEDAEDLTQAFFSKLLDQPNFSRLDSEKGKFRAFLLASLKNFLANEWDKTQRQKRGGKIQHLSLDWQSAEQKFQVAASSEPSPDEAYDREWAVALLERVIDLLQKECEAEGTGERFKTLKIYLTTGKGEASYFESAQSLSMSESSLRVAVHRLRKRYRELLRHEVSHTLLEPTMVEDELATLQKAFT